ncbi:MAG: glycosyltransferase family 4 protein [Deltaproteobacteria bacterium]|nr:glycosyltransferase family 4 protein [Deltaproteobacteria bacterium]
MKILHFIYDDPQNPWCGGGGAYRARVINERLVGDHSVAVVTGKFPGAQNEDINGVDYIRTGSSLSYPASRTSFTFLAPFYMRKPCDIVVVDFSAYAPCFASLFTGKPVIYIMHHSIESHSLSAHPLMGFPATISEKIFLRLARNIITPSEALKDRIVTGYPGKNVIAIPNGVSEKIFKLIPKEEEYILFLGRIDIYMKGLDILINAFKEVDAKGILLKIAGGGEPGSMDMLRDMVHKHHLGKHVKILGRVSDEEKLKLLKDCLFLVMPSRFEGWGITALEANAAGKPVIGTKIPGLSEAVIDEQTAVLVEPEDAKELTRQMNLLLHDRAKRVKLGSAGRERARRFAWKTIALQQFGFYRSVLDHRPAP